MLGIKNAFVSKLLRLCHKKKKYDFYKSLFRQLSHEKKEGLIFDIGANIGDRTKLFLELGYSVVAVEPNPELVMFLRKKFKRYVKNGRLKILDKAINNEKGKIEFYIYNNHVLSTCSKEFMENTKQTGRFGKATPVKTLFVESTTLDELCNKYGIPFFIKIDVEGFEYEVLSTLKNNLISAIAFEFAIPESLSNTLLILKHLNKIGYSKFNISFFETMELISPYYLNYEQIMAFIKLLPDLSWEDIYVFR
jgi:FkbM family methyltransferase